jgi:hypothetical protein
MAPSAQKGSSVGPARLLYVLIVLAAIIIGLQVFTWYRLTHPPHDVIQWEYKVVFLQELGIKKPPTGPQYDFDFGTLQQELTGLGQEGWELAAIHYVMAPPGVTVHTVTPKPVEGGYHGVAVFKRRIARQGFGQ